MKYSLVDSFSGAGGLSLGLEQAGFKLIYSFDNDPNSVKTQTVNKGGGVGIALQDIDDLLRRGPLREINVGRGDLFLLAGGPPCQGFSIQRIGNDVDERNNLVLKYAQLIGAIFPRFFLMENVPGLLGKRGADIFDRFNEKARKLGYVTYSSILNAEDFGVPQRRKRLIVIGVRIDVNKKPFSFPKPTNSMNGRVTVKETIGHLPSPPKFGKEHPTIPNHRSDRLSTINLQRIRSLKPGQGREYLPDNLLADCHKTSPDKIGHRNVYGRMTWNDVAPTITARFDSFTRGMFGHPKEDRSITLREGALLQTFPKNYLFIGSKVEVARQIGNAVPPKMAKALGEAIIEYWKSTR